LRARTSARRRKVRRELAKVATEAAPTRVVSGPQLALPVDGALFGVTVVHALGKTAGRLLCGTPSPNAPASPVTAIWGTLTERRPAVEIAYSQLLNASDAGSSCPGCLANFRRMSKADERKIAELGGLRNGAS
jgi:hypothetical protein